MKKLIIIYSLVMLVGCKTKTVSTSPKEVKKSDFALIPADAINAFQKKRTYELGKRVLETCNTSKFKPFTTEEATADVIQRMTPEKISIGCQNILRGFGKFNDMKLIEVYHIKKEDLTIYRYKCDYEKKYKVKELRVSINGDNKITSITTKDWKDDFDQIAD